MLLLQQGVQEETDFEGKGLNGRIGEGVVIFFGFINANFYVTLSISITLYLAILLHKCVTDIMSYI